MTIFYVLLVFILIAAVIAIETKNLLSSVICIGAVGFGASLLFLFLRAPDIAITQIVVEVLGLIILIRATIARDLTFIGGDREFFGTVVSVVVIFVIFLAGIRILETKSAAEIKQIRESQPGFVALPDFGTPIFDAISQTPLFSIDLKYQGDLDDGIISEELRKEFERNKARLSQDITVSVEETGNKWVIADGSKKYSVTKEHLIHVCIEAASQTYLSEGLGDTGAANIVAAVILDYRAYDTLGEATVLFTSIIGATVILRKKTKKLLEEPDL